MLHVGCIACWLYFVGVYDAIVGAPELLLAHRFVRMVFALSSVACLLLYLAGANAQNTTLHSVDWFYYFNIRHLQGAETWHASRDGALCPQDLRNCFDDPYSRHSPPGVDYCTVATTCVLNSLSSSRDASAQTDMQSANILMGLLPTVLAFTGLTFAETSLLYSQRPISALALSVGSAVM